MNKEKLIAFFKKETILCISGALAFVSAFIIPPDHPSEKHVDPFTGGFSLGRSNMLACSLWCVRGLKEKLVKVGEQLSHHVR